MARDEGWALVEALTAHATQARLTYLHTWRRGDLLIWDELATMHRGAGDSDPTEPRVMMRSIVYPPEFIGAATLNLESLSFALSA